MEVKTIATNGDHRLPERTNAVRPYERTSVIIIENIDGATITFGVADDEGNFIGYADGAITEDGVINHGFATELMVRISGIITNPVKMGLSN